MLLTGIARSDNVSSVTAPFSPARIRVTYGFESPHTPAVVSTPKLIVTKATAARPMRAMSGFPYSARYGTPTIVIEHDTTDTRLMRFRMPLNAPS